MPSNTLYVSTGRTVLALNPVTGSEYWRVRLPGIGHPIATLLLKDQHLFVGHRGRVYCLDARSGSKLWQNDLPGTGHGIVLLNMWGAVGTP